MKCIKTKPAAGMVLSLFAATSCVQGPETTNRLVAHKTIDGTESKPVEVQAATRERHASVLELAYFDTPQFKQRFAESFLAVSDVEPALTREESEVLRDIVELITEGKKERAMTRLERANNEAAGATFSFLIGQLHFDAERHTEALAAFDDAIDRFSRFQRAWNNKALIHYQDGQFAEAAAAFGRALTLGKVDETTYGLMAVCLLNEEKYISAEMAFRQALMFGPNRVEWKQGLARCLFKEERYPEAVSLFAGLIAEEPGNAGYWLLQGNALLGMGETRRAAENFQIADQLGGSTAGSLTLLADIYSNDGLMGLAVRAYIDAFIKDADASPDRALRSARMMTDRGSIVSATELLDGIQAHFGESLSDDKTAAVLKLRAKIAVRNGDGEAEIEILEAIAASDPLDGDAIILLGEAFERAGRLEAALLEFQVAAGIEGFAARAKVRHAQTLVRAGRYAEAVPLLKASLQNEEKVSVRDFLANVEKAAKRSGR